MPVNVCDVKPELGNEQVIQALIEVFQEDETLGRLRLFYESLCEEE